MLKHESFYNRFQEYEQHDFIKYAENFIAWMDGIEDVAWINEIIHVSRQMEEYAEEIRLPGRHPEIEFSYAEYCLPSFAKYCEWFEQLPWDNPEQVMTPTMLLAGIQRDLEIAQREMKTLETLGVIPFIKRSVRQAKKNVMDMDKKTASSSIKQRKLWGKLSRRIEELNALITYADIMNQDSFEQAVSQNQHKKGVRYDYQLLTEDFGNKGPFADYYIRQIDKALSLCDQLHAEFEQTQ